MEIFQIIWFALLGVLLSAFLITGGFDFGVNMLMCCIPNPKLRNVAMREIAPFWDGNQVWLITAGGALFAAFPKAYSAILSMLYTPVILLLACLIFRVVAIEFYLSIDTPKWRNVWAKVSCISSFLSMLLIGVALGAIFGGEILVSHDGFWKSFLRLFTPLTVSAGILTVLFCLAQGGQFLAIKNSKIVEFKKLAKWSVYIISMWYLLYVALFFSFPKGGEGGRFFCMISLILAYIPLSVAMRLVKREHFKTSFTLTSLFALICVAAHMFGAYPYIVSPLGESAGISIFDASSSLMTLKIMLWVAVVGVPLALAYFIYAHFVFAKSDSENSYDDNGY